ncbi:MAG: hypothetical protein EOP87_08070, partial [Verrucomicrobiaceae bacterium]
MAESLAGSMDRLRRLDGFSPVEVARRLRHLPGMVFFDSAAQAPFGGTRVVSVIAARPVRILKGSIFSPADRTVLEHAHAAGTGFARDYGFPLGGLCGWVDYEGDFVFGEYREMLVHCHDDDSWWETGGLSSEIRHGESAEQAPVIGNFDALTGRERFIAGVERVKEWIAAGDIYQVNLSQAFRAEVSGGSLFDLYESLREASPAPMAAWLSLDGREVLSSSPETFLKISGRGGSLAQRFI